MKTIIVWIRNDLRLHDNPALYYALATGMRLVCVYIHEAPLGMASRAWLEVQLKTFQSDLKCEFQVHAGNALAILPSLVQQEKAEAVYFNRRYEPHFRAIDQEIERTLPVKTFPGNVLFEPGTIMTREGKPFQVFTPFWKELLKHEPPRPLPSIATPVTTSCPEWRYLHFWQPTEVAALQRMDWFVKERLSSYQETRDIPSIDGTSRLSPYLHFGVLSIRTLWHACNSDAGSTYLRELAWREFAFQLLHHFPTLPDEPLRPEFQKLVWNSDYSVLKKWQEGKTGYPIIDAGMRELLHTGWMHNRVRMIVGSFLVKHLLIPWQEGERWFWEHLVDADLANNSFGWQWVAGCGADAAPYFRIFNPVLQAKKFDPEGRYVRRWLAELNDVPDALVHTPWPNYIPPIVDLTEGRNRALQAFEGIRKRR